MGDLPISDCQTNQRIGSGDEKPAIAGGHRRNPGDANPATPDDRAGSGLQTKHFTPLAFGNQQSFDEGQWGADRACGGVPERCAVRATQRVDPALRSRGSGEHRLVVHQDSAEYHPRESLGPADFPTPEIDRIHLPVDASTVEQIVAMHQRAAESSPRARAPDWRGSITGHVGCDRRRRGTQVDASRVDAPDEQG